MKDVIKHYFPLLLTVLCSTFAISLLFQSITQFSSAFSNVTETDNLTFVAKEIESKPKVPLPSLHYIGNSLTVGDSIALEDLFMMHFLDGTTAHLRNTKQAAVYLLDIKSQNGTSVLSRFSSDEIYNMDELPSMAVYDTQQHVLYFRNSGIYTFYIRFYYDSYAGILYECEVPVEVR